MARALGKPHLRLLAVDDGPFDRRMKYAPVAVVALSLPDYVEGVRIGWVRVDGRDITRLILYLIRGWDQGDGARVILLDGIAYGGFNLVDIDLLHRELGRPVITVTRRRPDLAKIRAAIWKYFPRDARARWRLIARHPLFPVPTGAAPIFASARGVNRRQAVGVLQRARRRGFWPEALRLAHLFAFAAAEARHRKGSP